MITIKRFVFNAFQENTFVLYDDSKECIIVDPGCYTDNEKKELTAFIEQNELKPVAVYLTHAHIDHILGCRYLYESYQLAPQGHTDDTFFITEAVPYAKNFGFEIEEPPALSKHIDEKQRIRFGNSEMKILYVPGHSNGSLAFVAEQEKFVIVGDVLFAGSIGRTDLPDGDYDKLITSIYTQLLTLDDDFTVYSGHGAPSSIGTERISNPFING